MKTTIEKVKNIIEKSKSLIMKEVTENLNGYPEPIVGFAVFGFNSFEEILQFNKEHGGKIVSFKWKSGWSCANIHDHFITEEYDILYFALEDYKNELIYTDKESLIESIRDYATYNLDYEEEDEIENLIDEWHKIAKEVKWEKEFVVVYNIENLSYDTLPYRGISYYYDWNNYEIGVFFAY